MKVSEGKTVADIFLLAYIYMYLTLYVLWVDQQETGGAFKAAATVLSNLSLVSKPTRK